MKCKGCGKKADPKKRFCPWCGQDPSRVPEITCPKCGTVSTEGHYFCQECGHQIRQYETSNLSTGRLPTDVNRVLEDAGITNSKEKRQFLAGIGVAKKDESLIKGSGNKTTKLSPFGEK
jgi:DNA-directed RNA polymerase subunit RPC12/RpoP